MKKTYRVKGHEHLTRTTERTYTHAVIRIFPDGVSTAPNFCGSYELAVKAANALSKFKNTEIHVCEVEEVVKAKKAKKEEETKMMYGVKNLKNGQFVVDTKKAVRLFETKKEAQALVDKMVDAHPEVAYEVAKYEEKEAPEAPKKKTTKKEETAKKVLLMTFTGMEIGHYDIVKKTSSTIVIQAKNGEQTFSVKDMKQTNAKNPRFANKIKLV